MFSAFPNRINSLITSSVLLKALHLEIHSLILENLFSSLDTSFSEDRKEKKSIPADIFQTAWEVDPEWHLKIQAVFQKYTENAVSKTVNFPASATIDDIERLFLMAVDMLQILFLMIFTMDSSATSGASLFILAKM